LDEVQIRRCSEVKKRILLSVAIAVLVLSLIPGLAIAGPPSMQHGNSSVVTDPIGDILPQTPEAPAYADIKKTQITHQTGRDTLVFSMNLAGVVPSEPSDDDLPNELIIYNWYLDLDLSLPWDCMVTLSWTPDDEWVASLMRRGAGEFASLTPIINGSRIQVTVDIQTIETEFEQIITEFSWYSVVKYATGSGSNWDVAPDTLLAYWSR